jgi:hypothetical protein
MNEWRNRPKTGRQCGTMPVHHAKLEADPDYMTRLADLEQFTRTRRSDITTARVTPITIPVVVHIVLPDPGDVSDAQVDEQIDVLNLDFRGLNPDRTSVPGVWAGLVSDTMIGFRLANVAPDGSATTGITRTVTTKTNFFSEDEDVKFTATGGHDAWPAGAYLNLWVCKIVSRQVGPLLGYGQFPGGASDTDGVVIDAGAFGTSGTAQAPFDLGRTATHEVGHYLNLYHIWGAGDLPSCNDSDFVEDTPNQFGPNRDRPAFPHISCQNGPNGDMFMNYMDYVDDVAMFMFTHQQAARMQATLAGPRSTLGR